MDSKSFCDLLKSEIASHFDSKNLCAVGARRYKYTEQTFQDDCSRAVSFIPINVGIDAWLTDNVVCIGNTSSGSYLALSALYCVLSDLPSEAKKLTSIREYIESLRAGDTDTSDESSQSGSENDSDEGENPMLPVLRGIYDISVKEQLVGIVSGLSAAPPTGVTYSKKRLDEDQAMKQKLADGMRRFEAATDAMTETKRA